VLLGTILLTALVPDSTGRIYDGSRGQLAVAIPRLEQALQVDGSLTEPAWAQAAVLTGFSRYAPSDGAAAENRTEVLVWFSPTAIHFGIRAHARAGTVRATLADRDRIFADDHILLFLSTFNDGRQALVFGVNPLGVQGDGSLVETGAASSGGFRGQAIGREGIDVSQDFVFQSAGRLTDYGYEVEVRIPFKSLKYQPGDRQDWGLSVTRQVQSLGHEDSWAPARRAAPSFLGQGGQLQGIHSLSRGLVLDVSPVVTAKTTGGPGAGGDWAYGGGAPEVGANARWGITPNLTLNGTIWPDFAEVESDASQVVYDPRSAVFFAERRPFFLDGIENFTTPNRLIYTRRLLEPIAAVKLTGKTGGTSLGYIAGVDDEEVSLTGDDHAVYNMFRVQQDMGRQSRSGAVLTHRVEGDRTNLVAGVDGNLVLHPTLALQWQAARSWTSNGPGTGGTRSAPLWQGALIRSGRAWAARFSARGVHQDFVAASGFLSRTDIASARLSNQFTTYGQPGGLFERGSAEVVLDGTWTYDDLVNGRDPQDRKLHFNQNVALRGGWTLGASVLIESFGYDPRLYHHIAVERTTGAVVDTIAYNDWVPATHADLPNLDYVISLNTPRLGGWSLNTQLIWGQDENFFEWSSAKVWIVNGGVQWRPTDKVRLDGTYVLQSYRRKTDGSSVSVSHIPRVKLEYQVTRSVFLRAVGEYRYVRQDDLRDDSRSEGPLLVRNPSTGVYQRGPALGFTRHTFRGDLLLSVLPSPGTVLFLGYGNTLRDPDLQGDTGRLRRINDAFFLKLSYLFRTS
jgi:hypothetical protein